MDEPLTKKERRALAKEKKREEQLKSESTKKLKNWVIGVLIIVGLIVAGVKFWQWANTAPEGVPEVPLELTDSEWMKGNPQASVALVEYGDFQCPACATYYPIVKTLTDDYGEDLKVVYRHIPLVAIHTNAMDAARAAEAAGLQGKFWEMHDKLYENQKEWENERNPIGFFEKYAEEIELDLEKYKVDFASSGVQDEIDKDIFTANRLGVNSTPTFFLNGERIQNPRGLDDFRKSVDSLIQ